MQELQAIKLKIKEGAYQEALMLIDELEEMGKEAIIRNIERYLVILLSHLIKHQAEERMTNSWLSTIANSITQIQKLNLKGNKKSWYIKDWDNYLDEAIELAVLEASEEAFGGIYSAEQLEEKFQRDRVLNIATELLNDSCQTTSKQVPMLVRKKFAK
jgi:hypothetical protein